MVDRTYCTLYLIGEFSRCHAKRFASVIDQFGVALIQVGAVPCETFDKALTQPDKANPHALLEISFQGIAYGVIPHELEILLTEIGSSWAWRTRTGPHYGSSISFHRVRDADTDEMQYTSEHITSEILLPLPQAASPLDLKAAIAWRNWFANAAFQPVDTNIPQPSLTATATRPASQSRMVCKTCGTDNVSVDAVAHWSIPAQTWEVNSILEHSGFCADCGADTTVIEAI